MEGDIFKLMKEFIKLGERVPVDFRILYFDQIGKLQRTVGYTYTDIAVVKSDGGKSTAESITKGNLEKLVAFANSIYGPPTEGQLQFYLRDVNVDKSGNYQDYYHVINSANSSNNRSITAVLLPHIGGNSIRGEYGGNGILSLQYETALNPGVYYVFTHEIGHGIGIVGSFGTGWSFHHAPIKQCLMDDGHLGELSDEKYKAKRVGKLCDSCKNVLVGLIPIV